MNQDAFNLLSNLISFGLVWSLMNLISNILVKLPKENKTIFLLGEFNIDLWKYCYHSATNKFFNSISCLMCKTNKKKNSKILIDNIYSNVITLKNIR